MTESSERAPQMMLNFKTFPNEMISGLSGDEIDSHVLQTIDYNVDIDEDLSLNQDQDYWTDAPPSPLTLQPSSSHSSSLTSRRFSNPTSDEEINRLHQGGIPISTIRRNSWGKKLFEEWREQRKTRVLENELFADKLNCDLMHMDNEALSYWLSKFIVETRKRNGERYPQNSLVSLIAGIQGYLKFNGKNVNIFKDNEFESVRRSLDTSMKLSTSEGLGLKRRQSEQITFEEEEKLWDTVLGDENPGQLLDSLFYLNGIHFALRSGKEHRDLSIEQIHVDYSGSDPCIVYSEIISKTYQGGLKQRRIDPKVVRHVDTNFDNCPSRSHVRLFEKYLKVRPEGTTVFYLKAKKNYEHSSVWYTSVPLGHNTLRGSMSRICQKANINGRKTNHSCRTTCVTRLLESKTDDHAIMGRTGHRSLDGLRAYKRMGKENDLSTSIILDNNSKTAKLDNSTKQGSTSAAVYHFHSGCIVNIYNAK